MQNYLRLNVDILFGMGTSLLEGASLYIPSVLTISSEDEIIDDKFLWLFDLKDYDLGIYRDHLNSYRSNIATFKDVVNDIYNNDKKKEFGKKCYDHFIKNHNIENSISDLLRSVSRSKLSGYTMSRVT